MSTLTDARPCRRTRPSSVPARLTARCANVAPNWYAAVMGTGIVATAGTTLPIQLPGQRIAVVAVWLMALTLLVALTIATAVHWTVHRGRARQHHRDPVMAYYYGAPPMALLTVGAGALLLGPDLVGLRLAVGIDAALWTAGTALGLVSAVAVPYLMVRRPELRSGGAFGGWLMPVVPPMVSAATGALLLSHVPAGPARLTLLLACYAMFGLSLVASVIVIRLIWSRLAQHGAGPVALVPTLFIVLGPLGQSVTAANLLGGNAHLALAASTAQALEVLGVAYGLPVIGFAALWAARATAVIRRTVRATRAAGGGLPFTLAWWSFTFPVGTCVTGLSALSVRTGWTALELGAAGAYAVLLVAWVSVAARTARGVADGSLLARPPRLSPARAAGHDCAADPQ